MWIQLIFCFVFIIINFCLYFSETRTGMFPNFMKALYLTTALCFACTITSILTSCLINRG